MPMIGQLSDNVLSNRPIFWQCFVQQSNGWLMLCPTVRWLVSWVFNSPMIRLCFFQLFNAWTVEAYVQLSNGRIMLFQTVNGWTVLCPTVQLLVNVRLIFKLQKKAQCRGQEVLKDNYIVLNCLVGCINIFFDILLTLSKCCKISRILSDS